MTRSARRLVDDLAVPFEAEPGEPVDDRGDRLGGRAHPVGILDAQQELAVATRAVKLVVAREEPVEEGGAGAADMEEAGRRGGETDDDAHRPNVGSPGRSRHPIIGVYAGPASSYAVATRRRFTRRAAWMARHSARPRA